MWIEKNDRKFTSDFWSESKPLVFCGPIEGHAFLDAELPDAVNGSAVKVRETWNSKNESKTMDFCWDILK